MKKKILGCMLKPRLSFLAAKDGPKRDITWQRVVLRVFLSCVTAIWIGFFPTYLFLLYMAKEKFFSYDFFVDGVFGATIFIAFAALLLLFLSFTLYGFLCFLRLGVTKVVAGGKNDCRVLTWVFFLGSVSANYVLFIASLEKGSISAFLFLNFISLLVVLYFFGFCGHSAKHNLQNTIAPILFISATVILPPWFSNVTSNFVALGLRQFNVGGGVMAEVRNIRSDERSVSGNLLLLTPENAYMRVENELTIVPISNHTKVTVGP